MAEMQELNIGQRVLYQPASSPKSVPPRPCVVVRKLNDRKHAGNKAIVQMAGVESEQAVYTTSLYVPDRTCRECGCIEEWACEGSCYWASEDLCSRCEAIAQVRTKDGDVANRLLRFKRALENLGIPVGIGIASHDAQGEPTGVRVVFSL
jgi:hypothetical protein